MGGSLSFDDLTDSLGYYVIAIFIGCYLGYYIVLTDSLGNCVALNNSLGCIVFTNCTCLSDLLELIYYIKLLYNFKVDYCLLF